MTGRRRFGKCKLDHVHNKVVRLRVPQVSADPRELLTVTSLKFLSRLDAARRLR